MAPPLTVGWVYNLAHAPDESNALKLVCIATIFSGLSCCALLLRLFCRWHILKTKGADDAATALSFGVGTAYCANAIFRAFSNLTQNLRGRERAANVLSLQKPAGASASTSTTYPLRT